MHKITGETGRTYTATRIRLTGSVEQRDGYAPDVSETVELVTCDECGAVVLHGDWLGQLESRTRHDRWHDQLSGHTENAAAEQGWLGGGGR